MIKKFFGKDTMASGINIVIGIISYLIMLFIFAAIFMLVYNSGVPALMRSLGSDAIFQQINFWESLSIIFLLSIVGMLLFKKMY